MKRWIAMILAAAMMLSLTACGFTILSGGGGTETKGQGDNSQTQSGVSVGSVTIENFTEVSASVYGVGITKPDGWTVTEATSPNGVNNLSVKMTASGSTDGRTLIKEYFEKTLALGGVYQQKIDWDTLAISKGTQYTDFDTFAAAEITAIDTLSSAMWLYDYNGKCVQISINADGGNVEFSLCFVTLNLEIDLTPPNSGTGPEGWVWQDDHGWIKGVWDSNVLPENFPKEIAGVKVEDTTYYGVGAERYSTQIGDLYFEDYNYEEWELSFYATDDQLAAFGQALADLGFVGGEADRWNDTVTPMIVTDGSIYLYYTYNETDDEPGYKWEVWCNLTYIESEYPAIFEGIELPQFGLFTDDPMDQFMGWDAEFNEVEVEYDFSDGTGELPAYYSVWLDYGGVTRETYDAYVASLKNLDGVEQWDQYDYGDGFVTIFKKGDYYFGVYYNFDGGEYTLTFVSATETESMFY
ncbi:MAG: hypothetical protein IJA58_08420 [Lachnospiraceae bacterium]|nr:hypothetical protein [Lachnospiraceae bacterium]